MSPQLQGTTSGISLQGSSNTLQNPANPTNYTAFTDTSAQPNLSLTSGTSGTGIDYGAVSRTKGDISALIQSIGNLYDTLYNTQVGVAKEQAGNLQTSYDLGTKALADTFASEMPKLQASYNARGTGDSTEAMTAAYQAGKGYEQQLADRQTQFLSNQAKLGESLATSKAGYTAQQDAYNRALQTLQSSTNIDELTTFKNALDQKLAELQAQQAGTMSEAGYRQALSQAIPQQPDTASLQANLTTLIQGQAAPTIKKSLGLKMIDISGLSEDVKKQLSADFIASVDAEAQKVA